MLKSRLLTNSRTQTHDTPFKNTHTLILFIYYVKLLCCLVCIVLCLVPTWDSFVVLLYQVWLYNDNKELSLVSLYISSQQILGLLSFLHYCIKLNSQKGKCQPIAKYDNTYQLQWSVLISHMFTVSAGPQLHHCVLIK